MTPEQWSRVKDIFGSALEQQPERRRARAGERGLLDVTNLFEPIK